ncbi:hypothetical protein INR49_022223 [Caranx melampygus]|nr:hypothetical protein INR49_022223 [Caranx melampygus]
MKCYDRCTMCRLLNVLLALLSRFLFAVHGVVTVWRVVAVKGEPLYWLVLTGVALLGVEMAVTLNTVIPSIWFLELSLLQSKLPVNNSSGPELRLLAHIPITVGIVELDPENWVAGLEQTMLIVLVLGRWLMPKGDMSGTSCPNSSWSMEPEVKTKPVVVIVGLSLFSWALMQFPLVLTQTRPPKGESPQGKVGDLFCFPGAPTSCCSSEVWSLLLTVGLQDGPFLLYRLYLMVQEQVLNQLMIFFTCKNILIVLLELYRIFVVQCEQTVGEWGLEKCAAPVLWCGAQRGEGVRGEEREEDVGVESRAVMETQRQSWRTITDMSRHREDQNAVRHDSGPQGVEGVKGWRPVALTHQEKSRNPSAISCT